MSAKDYIAFVFDEISELKEKGLDKKPYSDTVDSEGNQYVDLVLEGGGVLGVALLGYLYVLEQAGLRFLGLGGTSAGSITALITAAIDEPAKPKAMRIIDLLADMPMMDFVDGDQDAREFVEAMLKDAGWLRLAWKAGQVVDNIFENLGLNPGAAFRDWLEKTLDTFGVWSTLSNGATTTTRTNNSSVTLVWDASPDTDVQGYKVYYGTVSGENTSNVDIGITTSTTINGLSAGVTYFFVATAYNTAGLESDPSNEVSWTVPTE